MRRLLTLIVLSVLAAPVATRADGSISVTASAGVTKPFGDVANGQKLGDAIDWAFPLEAQLGFRLLKQLSLGGYVRFAPTSLPSGCTGCTVTDLAFGGRLEYRFSERLEGGGWIGAFAGYDQLKSEVKLSTGSKNSVTYSGLEGGLAAGADFELGGLTMGPWVQGWLGQFTKQSGDVLSSSLASKGVHGFFGAGIRMTLLL
jgi:hypothetical protein